MQPDRPGHVATRGRPGGIRLRALAVGSARHGAPRPRPRAALYSGLAGLCALLAASIGIAALLFVSVSERSREIGIHRALGASRLRIYAEYVLAAVLLSGGGALGGALLAIPASAGGAFGVRWQPALQPVAASGRQLPKLSELALSVSWEAAAIAILLAVACCAGAALIPAYEAAAQSPALAIARRANAQRGVRQALTCGQVGLGVLVLVVLTAFFAYLDNDEKTEARRSLGEDKVFAVADPIWALRQAVSPEYRTASGNALDGGHGRAWSAGPLARQHAPSHQGDAAGAPDVQRQQPGWGRRGIHAGDVHHR